MNRREISTACKERELLGGVYTITNPHSGAYILGHAADLASVRNRFQFAVSTGSAVDPRLRQDRQALGAATFRLDVLEELEQASGQTHIPFMDDLAALEQLWRARLDPSLAY